MLNLENRLFVFHDDNSVFTDHSNGAQDYSRDEFAIELNKDEDFLLIGFRKPVNAVYFEMDTANTNANSFAFEYFKDVSGTPTATAITEFLDETKGLIRSGFFVWERNLEGETKTTINGQEAFWYRLRPSVTHSAGTIIQGLNIVFSDDNDLQGEVANISSYLPSGATTFILSHNAAKNQIIQDLRNTGKLKLDINTGRLKNLNVFDVLDIGQIRETSKWKTLAIIFDDTSDRPDDKYDQRARKYNSRYQSSFHKLQFLALDTDDDGKLDIGEEQASFSSVVLRR